MARHLLDLTSEENSALTARCEVCAGDVEQVVYWDGWMWLQPCGHELADRVGPHLYTLTEGAVSI